MSEGETGATLHDGFLPGLAGINLRKAVRLRPHPPARTRTLCWSRPILSSSRPIVSFQGRANRGTPCEPAVSDPCATNT